MTLRENLYAAERAVNFANDKLRGRSSNRPEDLIHTLQDNIRHTFANPATARSFYLDTVTNPSELGRKTNEIWSKRVADINNAREDRRAQGQRLNAAAIMADNIGNCFEHCVLACHYLKRLRNPIASYMADTDDNTNHCFVLIGAPNGLHGRTVNVTRQAPGAIAGMFTVVCDPWYHEWFAVQQDWRRKMWQIFSETTKEKPTPDSVPLTLTSSDYVT